MFLVTWFLGETELEAIISQCAGFSFVHQGLLTYFFITLQNIPLLENTLGFLAVHEIWQSTFLKHDNFSDIVTYCKGYPSFLNYTN